MAKRDYYEVLGVSRNATQDEIKKAHRRLARQYHPDMNKNNKASEEKFKEVQEAYDALADPVKRRNYDQFGHAGVGVESGAGHGPGVDPFAEAFRNAQRNGRTHTWRGSPGVSVEDYAGAEQFADLFEQFFGPRAGRGATGRGAPRGRTRPEQARGNDVEHPVTLSFEQAARGTALPLQINRDGKIETIEVKIPAGVRDGSRVRIRGRGQHPYAAEPGDLFIVTKVLSHPYYRREGLDILLDLPLSLYEALLGTKVTVPTLDGTVTLTIPPGTSSGAKLRIKSHGIERAGEKGDQLVVIKIVLPRNLDEQDKEVIARLAGKHPLLPRADVPW